MSPMKSARFNSNYSTNIGQCRCTAETHKKIIQDLKTGPGKREGQRDIKKYVTELLHSMYVPTPIIQPSKTACKMHWEVVHLCHDCCTLYWTRLPCHGLHQASGNCVGSDHRLRRTVWSTSILSAVLEKSRLKHNELYNIHLTLQTVVCVRKPVTLKTIESLHSLKKNALWRSLGPLWLVLYVQEGVDGQVAPFHASFLDYMLQCNWSKQFHCDAAQHHRLLVNSCFNVMKAKQQFNICHLELSFVFDKDVPDLENWIKKNISPWHPIMSPPQHLISTLWAVACSSGGGLLLSLSTLIGPPLPVITCMHQPSSLWAVAHSRGVCCCGHHCLPLVPVIVLSCVGGAGAGAGGIGIGIGVGIIVISSLPFPPPSCLVLLWR